MVSVVSGATPSRIVVAPSSVSLFIQKPFEACFPFIQSITSFFERLVTWPRDFGQAIMNGTESFPEP